MTNLENEEFSNERPVPDYDRLGRGWLALAKKTVLCTGLGVASVLAFKGVDHLKHDQLEKSAIENRQKHKSDVEHEVEEVKKQEGPIMIMVKLVKDGDTLIAWIPAGVLKSGDVFYYHQPNKK